VKRNEIKKKAFSLFANKGYHDTSVQEIAKLAGINKVTLYFYFTSKAELYSEIMQDLILSSCTVISESIMYIPKEQALDRLKCFFTAFMIKIPIEEILLWKRTMLMCTNEYDETVKGEARRLFAERDAKLADIIKAILLDTGLKLKKEQINNYTEYSLAVIRGYTDVLITDQLRNSQHSNREDLVNRVWLQFWQGSKSVLSSLDPGSPLSEKET
jgi:AcrR family transcriptional regulator